MSEKRFVIDYDLDDLEEENVKLRAKIDEQQDIITELNKQIEQLLLAIDDLLSHTSCEEIKKENEQLKEECKIAIDEMVTDYKKLEKENEQLQTQLLICQQSKNDDSRIKVWQVPPIPKGMRITTSTTSDGDIDE